MSDGFATFEPSDVRDLLAEFPLAWVIAREGGAASLLPLLGEYDDDGRLVSLLGHMGRRNALHAQLMQAPAATILVNGPQGYVSPDHAGRRGWGPTWNYAQLTIGATVTFLPDATDHAIDTLVHAMEEDRWSRAELGERYDGMARAIIAFRARVDSLSGRFKLGQDEDPATFANIVESHPDSLLTRWMRRFHR